MSGKQKSKRVRAGDAPSSKVQEFTTRKSLRLTRNKQGGEGIAATLLLSNREQDVDQRPDEGEQWFEETGETFQPESESGGEDDNGVGGSQGSGDKGSEFHSNNDSSGEDESKSQEVRENVPCLNVNSPAAKDTGLMMQRGTEEMRFAYVLKYTLFPQVKFLPMDGVGNRPNALSFSTDPCSVCGFLLKETGMNGTNKGERWWAVFSKQVKSTIRNHRNNVMAGLRTRMKSKLFAKEGWGMEGTLVVIEGVLFVL